MRKNASISQTYTVKVTGDSLVVEQGNERFDWIKHLPRGEYDMKFLKAYSGLSCHSSIKGCMLRHGSSVRTVPAGRNLIKNIFTWPGYMTAEQVNNIKDNPFEILKYLNDIECVKIEGYLNTLWDKKEVTK